MQRHPCQTTVVRGNMCPRIFSYPFQPMSKRNLFQSIISKKQETSHLKRLSHCNEIFTGFYKFSCLHLVCDIIVEAMPTMFRLLDQEVWESLEGTSKLPWRLSNWNKTTPSQIWELLRVASLLPRSVSPTSGTGTPHSLYMYSITFSWWSYLCVYDAHKFEKVVIK